MARPQVVEEFLAEIGNGIGVEDEEIGLGLQDDALGLFQSRREIDLGGRSGFLERGANFLPEFEIGLEDEDAPALFGGS